MVGRLHSFPLGFGLLSGAMLVLRGVLFSSKHPQTIFFSWLFGPEKNQLTENTESFPLKIDDKGRERLLWITGNKFFHEKCLPRTFRIPFGKWSSKSGNEFMFRELVDKTSPIQAVAQPGLLVYRGNVPGCPFSKKSSISSTNFFPTTMISITMFFCSNVSHQVQSTKSEVPQYKHRQVLIVGTDLGTEVRTDHHMGNRGPRSEKVGLELEGGFGAWGGWPRRFLWETFWVSFFGSTLNVKITSVGI